MGVAVEEIVLESEPSFWRSFKSKESLLSFNNVR